ncbi:hypothetical protein FRC03_002856 [Tulasnella sp. 419]|nr:hypothetical protein FRC02_001437 [Tulasnella sp. 418]KAG8963556.1 hypothetical protein FRC03_002856 [Tulasnella sp. 419]
MAHFLSPPGTPQRTPSPNLTEYSLTTIHSSEADAYFREEGGRRFPVGADHPTSLPVDADESNRLRSQHLALKILLGSNHFGPMHQIITPSSPTDRRRRRVLDVYSTPGVWVQDLSVEYPNVKFVGVDIAPSVMHYPKDNLQFEIYNFPRDGFSCPDGHYDVVHARHTLTQIRDLPNLLVEIKRALRHGGLFMFGEIEMTILNADGRISVNTPGSNALLGHFRRALEAQGIRTNGAHEIDQWLEAVGGFGPVAHQVHMYPIGGAWLPPTQSRLREVGRLTLQNMERLAASMKPVLRHSGLSSQQVDQLVEAHLRDIRNPDSKAFLRYHTVWSIKE